SRCSPPPPSPGRTIARGVSPAPRFPPAGQAPRPLSSAFSPRLSASSTTTPGSSVFSSASCFTTLSLRPRRSLLEQRTSRRRSVHGLRHHLQTGHAHRPHPATGAASRIRRLHLHLDVRLS